MRRLLVIVLMLALAAPLVACGRKSAPKAPPGSSYPQTYPSQ